MITVLECCNDSQRQETKDACHIAGLDMLRTVNKPTTAALDGGRTPIVDHSRIEKKFAVLRKIIPGRSYSQDSKPRRRDGSSQLRSQPANSRRPGRPAAPMTPRQDCGDGEAVEGKFRGA